jgi:Putative prokaryotic signal transducing protein
MGETLRFVQVRAFTHPHDAHLARSALDAAGIPTSIADEHLVATDWLYSNAVGGVKLLVPADRLVEASEILDGRTERVELSAEGEATAGAHPDACLSCGGREFESVVRGRRWAALSWLVTGFPLVPVRRAYRCRECGRSFGQGPSHPV